MLSQKAILRQVRSQVSEAFKSPPIWVHDFEHVKRVVGFGRRILLEEGRTLTRNGPLSYEKFSFLVELACLLHDLGRTSEHKPTFLEGRFNHALESEKMARKMLMDVLRSEKCEMGSGRLKWEVRLMNPENQNIKKSHFSYQENHISHFSLLNTDFELVFQAIAEHNQPTPKHPDNLVTRVLQDADRGDGFGFRGMSLVFNYNRIIDTGRQGTEKDCKKTFLQVWPEILANKKKRKKAIHWLTFLTSWYTGGQALKTDGGEGFGKEKVCPLYTETAKRMYFKRYLIVKKYLEKLKS